MTCSQKSVWSLNALIAGGHRFLHAEQNLSSLGESGLILQRELCPVSLAEGRETPQGNMSEEYYVSVKRKNAIL